MLEDGSDSTHNVRNRGDAQ
jgi:hypothetical protein